MKHAACWAMRIYMHADADASLQFSHSVARYVQSWRSPRRLLAAAEPPPRCRSRKPYGALQRPGEHGAGPACHHPTCYAPLKQGCGAMLPLRWTRTHDDTLWQGLLHDAVSSCHLRAPHRGHACMHARTCAPLPVLAVHGGFVCQRQLNILHVRIPADKERSSLGLVIPHAGQAGGPLCTVCTRVCPSLVGRRAGTRGGCTLDTSTHSAADVHTLHPLSRRQPTPQWLAPLPLHRRRNQ